MPTYSHTGSFECPHCGEDVPSGAQRCRYCGASEEYDWGESDGQFAAGGYGDDDFDYDEFVEREFGSEDRPPADESKKFWLRIVVLAVVVALLFPLLLQLLTA